MRGRARLPLPRAAAPRPGPHPFLHQDRGQPLERTARVPGRLRARSRDDRVPLQLLQRSRRGRADPDQVLRREHLGPREGERETEAERVLQRRQGSHPQAQHAGVPSGQRVRGRRRGHVQGWRTRGGAALHPPEPLSSRPLGGRGRAREELEVPPPAVRAAGAEHHADLQGHRGEGPRSRKELRRDRHAGKGPREDWPRPVEEGSRADRRPRDAELDHREVAGGAGTGAGPVSPTSRRTRGPETRETVSRLVESYARSPEMAAALSVLSAGGASLGGFWGASLSFFLRAWSMAGKISADGAGARGPSAAGPVLIVTASGEESSEIVDELRAFGAPAVLEFPAWESLFLPDSRPDAETFRDRLLVLDALHRGHAGGLFIVAPVQAVLQPVLSGPALEASRLALRSGDANGPEALGGWLARKGFRACPLVAAPGELSWRGDILEFFPHVSASPLRLEFFGDTLESIREFSAETQRSSGGALESLDILVPGEAEMFLDAPREGNELIVGRLAGGGLFIHEPALVL